MALPIGGTWRIREMERSHLLAEARSWGVPEAHARTVIETALDAVHAGMTHADERYPLVPDGIRAAVAAQVERLRSSV